MYPSLNTSPGYIEELTISTEATTIPTLNSPYIRQTIFATIIKDLFDKFNENNAKQDAESKEIIAEQKAESDARFEKQIQTWRKDLKETPNKFSQNHE